MNLRIAALAAIVAVFASAPAYAGDPDEINRGSRTNSVKDLANYTNLSERRIQMILGCRTCFAEYRYTYNRSLAQFKRALGNERYEQLMAGRPVALDDQDGNRVASTGGARDHTSAR